jgi:hypothetical protein
MPTHVLTRRAALVSLGAFSAAALAGCNTTPTAGVQPGAAPPGLRIGAVNIDDGALVAYVGNPTAQWAQQALPGALAQAFGARMAPGDPGAVPLNISLNTLYLGGGGPADPDRMTGVATVGGHAISVHAVSTYISNPTDQALPEQALQGRVQSLAVAFAYRLKRKLGA